MKSTKQVFALLTGPVVKFPSRRRDLGERDDEGKPMTSISDHYITNHRPRMNDNVLAYADMPLPDAIREAREKRSSHQYRVRPKALTKARTWLLQHKDMLRACRKDERRPAPFS
jgi:hypothetical protein